MATDHPQSAPVVPGTFHAYDDDLLREGAVHAIAILPTTTARRTISLGGVTLRYQVDRRRAQSALHPRFAYLSVPTGDTYQFPRLGQRASEVLCVHDAGEFRALLWDTGDDVDLILNRRAAAVLAPLPGSRGFALLQFPRIIRERAGPGD